MPAPRRAAALTLSTTLAAGALLLTSPGVGAQAATCAVPEADVTYEQSYIDTSRAGGEPIIEIHPDGTMLWGSHAGTTHFYSPQALSPVSSAFIQNYTGQTYYYFSEDDGATWQFAPRNPIQGAPDSGVPGSGFSDPEFAVDTAGNVFISEINLANIAFGKSTDSGRSYTNQSLLSITMSDRQWMEADEEDVLWFVANTFGGGSTIGGEPVTGSLANRLYKSLDGGATFSAGQDNGPGQASSDIKVDQSDGRLYQLRRDGTLRMRVFADARSQTPPNVTFDEFAIAEDFNNLSSIGPTMALDDEGNLYVVWDEVTGETRDHGIWYSASKDRGVTWSPPLKLDDGTGTAFWPWVEVGDAGKVSVVWLQHETRIDGDAPDDADGAWHVMAAQSLTGLGCDTSVLAGFRVVQATTDPPHTGSMCNSGTTCQAFAVDRRLGDYFSNEIAADGSSVIAVSDTRSGGAISLPLVVRQTGGPMFIGPDAAPEPTPAPTPTVTETPSPSPLPATGGGAALALLGVAGAALLRRRQQA